MTPHPVQGQLEGQHHEGTAPILAALLLPALASLHAGEKSEADFAAMSPAQVRQYELDFMRRVADLALIPPTLNTTPCRCTTTTGAITA